MEITHTDSFVAKEIMQRIKCNKLLPKTCILRVLGTLMLERLYQKLNISFDCSDVLE